MNNDNITRDTSMNVADLMAKRNAELENNYGHGDYVPGENGEPGGFIIDTREEIRQKAEAPQINDIKKYISNQNNQIERLRNGESPASVMGEHGTGYREKEISERSGATDRVEIEKVRREFEKFEMGANGLVPAGSKEAQNFQRKMEDLESGKVNLEDYRDINKRNSPDRQMVQVDNTAEPHHVDARSSEPEVVQFNVDSNKANTFISTLDKSDRQRIQRASTVVVNEIKTLNIPTTTRVISSMSEYKRIAPRSIFGDTVECVLPNSGYIATVKGCGSLAMAVLMPDTSGQVDWNKRYQFCYDNLITTSIGKLSLQEFIAHTSMNDLNILLYNILRVSESDDQTVTLTCGASNCAKDYDVKYKVSQLLNTDDITPELSDQIDEIVKARDMVDTANAKHNSSPVMMAKYMQVEYPDKKVIIELKSPDGTIAIERMPMINELATTYSAYIVGMLLFIPRVYIEFAMDGETETSTYEVVDPHVIAELIGELNDSSTQAMSNIITTMETFDAMTYSFKGPYTCPHCGRVEERVPCELERLIFFRVQKAMQ